MIRLRWISWSWSNTLVLNIEALGHGNILIWRVAPCVLSDFLMQLLREGLGKSISESLDQHVIVVIAIIDVLLAHFFLFESSRDGEEADVVSLVLLLWADEVTHGNEVVLVLVELLSQGCELGLQGFAIGLVVNFNVVLLVSVARIESDYSSGLDEVLIYDLLEHFLGSVEKLLCLSSNGLVLEDLWIGSVWVLASDLPGLEERIPIDKVTELFEVVVLIDLSSQEFWLGDSKRLPVGLESL
jgi:hypothetical protein